MLTPCNPQTRSALAQKKHDFLRSLAQQALLRNNSNGRPRSPTFYKTLSASSREETTRIAAKQPRLIDGKRTIHFISGVKCITSRAPSLAYPNICLPYPAKNETGPAK